MYQQAVLAVALIIEKNGKILLGKRADDRDFAPELWEFPAGRVEAGETLEEAISREAMEELGITIVGTTIIDAYQFKRADKEMILLSYICDYKGDIRQSDEHKELRWVFPEEALHLFEFPQQQMTVKKYLQLRND